MVREDGKRNFALRDENGLEESIFTGSEPRDAALKAARRLETVHSSEEDARKESITIRLREKGTQKIHVYDAWSWTEETPKDSPDWLGKTFTEANVSKLFVNDLSS